MHTYAYFIFDTTPLVIIMFSTETLRLISTHAVDHVLHQKCNGAISTTYLEICHEQTTQSSSLLNK